MGLTDFNQELAARTRSAERRVARLETLEAVTGGGDFVFIERQDVSGGGDDFEFLSIPTIHTHLYIIYSIRGPGGGPGDTLNIQVNVDTGNNYDWHFRRFFSASIGDTSLTAQDSGLIGQESVSGSTDYGVGYILLPDYLNASKFKAARGGAFGNDAIAFFGETWLDTDAIVSLKFFLSSPPFQGDSLIDLYGIN